MAQKETPQLAPFDCSNPECSNTVKPRRRSATGDHWCPERACQAMKQRQLRAAKKAAGLLGFTQEEERIELVRLALHGERRPCPECDLEDGVPGFLHRAAPGSTNVCRGLGEAGRTAGPKWIDLIHPERATA